MIPVTVHPGLYGFAWGPVSVTRFASYAEKGWVIVDLSSKKTNVQVYVTKTGKMRVYYDGKEITPKGGA
jgi:hypothetical protein